MKLPIPISLSSFSMQEHLQSRASLGERRKERRGQLGLQVLPALQQEALDHPPVTRTLSSHLPAAPAPPWPAHISGQRQKPGPQGNKCALPCLLADCIQTRTQRLWGDCFIFPANITTCASASTLCLCVCAHVHTSHSLGQ